MTDAEGERTKIANDLDAIVRETKVEPAAILGGAIAEGVTTDQARGRRRAPTVHLRQGQRIS